MRQAKNRVVQAHIENEDDLEAELAAENSSVIHLPHEVDITKPFTITTMNINDKVVSLINALGAEKLHFAVRSKSAVADSVRGDEHDLLLGASSTRQVSPGHKNEGAFVFNKSNTVSSDARRCSVSSDA
eukprot:gene42367-52541_t